MRKQCPSMMRQHMPRTDGRTDALTQSTQLALNPRQTLRAQGGRKNSSISTPQLGSITRRLYEHKARSPWWRHVDGVIAFLYATRRQALDVEAHCIRWGNENSLYNRRGKGTQPPKPHEWVTLRDYDLPNGRIEVSREIPREAFRCERCGGTGWVELEDPDEPVIRCVHPSVPSEVVGE